MTTNKKSFVLHKDSLGILPDLTDEQAGKLFKAIYSYQIDEPIKLDQVTKLVFLPFKNQFIRDSEKWEKTREARVSAGSKGGKQRVANQANASKTKQSVANQAVSVSVSGSVSGSVNNKSSRFAPPTVQMVSEYCIERRNQIDANKFVDYYSTNGWMRGKTKIKDWKACVRTWESNSNDKKPQKPRAFSQ